MQAASNSSPSSTAAAANPASPAPASNSNQVTQSPPPDISLAALQAAATGTPSSTAAANTPSPTSGNDQTAQTSTINQGNTNPANANQANANQANVSPADTSLAALQAASTTTPSSSGAAAAKSPAAAAQAAIKGADGDSKSAITATDKLASQTSAAVALPQQQMPQQPQQQPALSGATNLPIMTAAPVQTANHAALNTTVQVAAQSATPDVSSLAVEIAARSQSGARQFDIRLDPPELGRVEIRLSIDATGKTEAHMTADQPDTLSLLQKDSGSLTQALRDAGLDVSDNGLNFSLRSGQQGQDHGGQGASAPRANLAANLAVDSVQSPSATSFTGDGDARLDISV